MLTALAFTLVVSVIVGAIGTLAVQHFDTASMEADNANAISLADAGIAYELNYISKNITTNNPKAHYAVNSTQYTGTISGVEGSFTVWVTNDPDDGAIWVPPNNVIIHSVGTVGGIVRKVTARGRRQSIFDAFATFGIEEVNFDGSGSIVNGDIGTNNDMNVVNANSNVPDPWTINLMGGTATINRDGDSGNIVIAPNPLNFPTITQIITSQPPVGFGSSGWAWLEANTGSGTSAVPTNRSNGYIRTFADSGADLTAAGTQLASAATGSPTPAHWNSSDVSIGSSDIGTMKSGQLYKAASGALTTSTGGGTLVTGGPFKAMILPTTYQITGADGVTRWYGDYYFTDINTGGGTGSAIIIDNGGLTNGHPGTIRIWMNDASKTQSSADAININVFFTDANAGTFRLYYNKCSTINVGGNSTYWGGFYAVTDLVCKTNSPPMISVAGGSTINGSVLAEFIEIQGGSVINFPKDQIDNPGDFSLWFGFKDEWKEVLAPGMGSVFYDGTNR